VAVTGTPKLGYDCNTCLDWGTIVVGDSPAEGVTHLRRIPCPNHTLPPAATPCRCNGSGTSTVVIPLADAVLLDERTCPVHASTSAEAGGAP
jgi:hypothetical protein